MAHTQNQQDGLRLSLNDIAAARDFVGRAQERIMPRTPLFRDLGQMFDALDSLAEAMREDLEGYYVEQVTLKRL